jgi:pheromone shutdown-related protein TraB
MTAEQIEEIKQKNEMDSMMAELAEFMPVIKNVLIDERNLYLATKIWQSDGKSVVAVLGAGHLDGVEECLKKLSEKKMGENLDEISVVPKKGSFGKIIGWLIPAAIIGLIIAGFIYGGTKLGYKNVQSWILWNGIMAAVFTLIGAGHPLTILTAFVSAPLCSLCPFVGTGFVVAIVQALICKPKVSDMETLQDDVTFKGVYKNRILRVLLLLILSTIGSSIATFVSGADIIQNMFSL